MCFFVFNGRSWCPFCCSAASRPTVDRTSQCKGRFLLAAGGHAKTDTSRFFWAVALLPVFFLQKMNRCFSCHIAYNIMFILFIFMVWLCLVYFLEAQLDSDSVCLSQCATVTPWLAVYSAHATALPDRVHCCSVGSRARCPIGKTSCTGSFNSAVPRFHV